MKPKDGNLRRRNQRMSKSITVGMTPRMYESVRAKAELLGCTLSAYGRRRFRQGLEQDVVVELHRIMRPVFEKIRRLSSDTKCEYTARELSRISTTLENRFTKVFDLLCGDPHS